MVLSAMVLFLSSLSSLLVSSSRSGLRDSAGILQGGMLGIFTVRIGIFVSILMLLEMSGTCLTSGFLKNPGVQTLSVVSSSSSNWVTSGLCSA